MTRTCLCTDPDLDRLRDMIRLGWSQPDASRALWHTPDPVEDTRKWVRAQFAEAFPWLQLPPLETGA